MLSTSLIVFQFRCNLSSIALCNKHAECVCVCIYSAYEQKRAAGGAKSSCPGTPMSPMQQHYSPKPATAGRPDAGYMNPTATSQPLPSNTYPINTRYDTFLNSSLLF